MAHDLHGDFVTFISHDSKLTALREQLATAEKRALEADIALSIRESDLDDANQTLVALGENPCEADLWAFLKRQRDSAVKRAEAAEVVVAFCYKFDCAEKDCEVVAIVATGNQLRPPLLRTAVRIVGKAYEATKALRDQGHGKCCWCVHQVTHCHNVETCGLTEEVALCDSTCDDFAARKQEGGA
jgi:hypothetical protein